LDLVEQAQRYRDEGAYQLALTCAQQSKDPRARAEEARCLVWLGRYSEAVDAARLGTTQASEDAIGWTALTESLIANGSPSDALITVTTALDLVGADASTPRGFALTAQACAQHALGHGPQAVGTATVAVEVFQKAKARPRDLALAFHCLAEAHHVSGQYVEAAGAWQHTLSLQQEELNADHPEIASTTMGMALTVRRLGLPEIAIELHHRAIVALEAKFGSNHPSIAACLHGLAQALHRQGRHLEARDHLSRALEISEHWQGPDHTHTWVTRFELGRLEVDCGDPARGFSRMEAARLRLTEKLGPSHPTIQAMANWM